MIKRNESQSATHTTSLQEMSKSRWRLRVLVCARDNPQVENLTACRDSGLVTCENKTLSEAEQISLAFASKIHCAPIWIAHILG